MLGEKIGQESGNVTGQRVLPSAGGPPRMETSFQAAGSILGIAHTTRGTYQSYMRPDGSLLGEGQGIVMGKDGAAMATWVGQGVGHIKPDGSINYRGAIFYSSPSPKWARLNEVASLFEYEIDPKGATKADIWEWK